MKKPKISVLTTVYNEDVFIKETIKSVLAQTFKDFEYVIIDDGSTDNTKKVIKSFKDKRIKYYYAGKNKGFKNLANTANFGLSKCNGKYIARIDADDICFPKRLEIQYNYLEKNKSIFMIGGSCDIIDQKGRVIDEIIKKSYPSILYRYHLLNSNPFIHSSVMFRNKGVLYPSWADFYFYIRMVVEKRKIKNIPQKLVQYRINPHGIVSKEGEVSKSKYSSFYKKS
jgi:glycosyltransferase involved in cell wall biosynthesis